MSMKSENPVAIITYSESDAFEIAREKGLTAPLSWVFIKEPSNIRILRDRKVLVRKDIPNGQMTPKMIRALKAVDETAQWETNGLTVEKV